ncbi:MAG: hypothetical protein EHM14_08245 [Methanothrix sp.]|nr:MAG: hypothetical protein EHM14_08245 [Methanothrix sp.]
MVGICRRVLRMGLAAMLLCCMAANCLAVAGEKANECKGMVGHPDDEGRMCQPVDGQFSIVPIEVVQSGHGFAFLGNGSHLLRLNVESLCPLEPVQVWDMLATNKSLDEIRNDIRTTKCVAAYRGGLMLDREIYSLINIVISPSDENSTTLDADVSESRNQSAGGEGNDAATLGKLSLKISLSDGGIVGKGNLELGGSSKAGKYSVLLDMMPRGPRDDKGALRDTGR